MLQHADIEVQVKAARAGETSAWQTLYQHYYPRLLSTALHICGHTPGVKDIVQESFITAFLKLHQLKDPGLFGGWIKKILLRKCYKALQKNYDAYIDLPDAYEPAELIEEAEKFNRLQASIAALPEVLRTTLLLRYFSHRQSYQQIAETLSVPVGTVRSRLNEARAKLVDNWLAVSSTPVKDEWNQFYYETLSRIHYDAEQRSKFLKHIHENALITMPGNRQINKGRRQFEMLVASDQACGSYLQPVEVISSGNITIIEQAHFNSPEHPLHCPPSSMVILYRKQEKAERIHLHAPGI